MANRVFLIQTDEQRFPEELSDESILAAANYQIPILWFALFTEDDIMHVTAPIEDERGNQVREEFPVLLVSTELGRRRVVEREQTLFAVLPADLRSYYQEWVALLEGVTSTYIGIDPYELWMMAEDGFEQVLRDCLNATTSTDVTNWARLLDMGWMKIHLRSGEVIYDPESVRFNMRGYGWLRPTPWDD